MLMKRYILLFSIIISILISSCDMAPSFSEYAGESFLATNSLTSEGWELMPEYNFISEGTVVDDYMDFTVSAETGPSGGHGGPVYRLEIKNLLPNGDFNTGAETPWLYYDKDTQALPIAPLVGNMDASGFEADIELLYVPSGSQERLVIYLESSLTPNTYVQGKDYLFQYTYSYGNSFAMYYFPEWDFSTTAADLRSDFYFQAEFGNTTFPPDIPEVVNVENPDNININRIKASESASYTDDVLGFARTSTQRGTIDNFSIVRSTEGDFDLRLRMYLDLDQRPDLEMISGYYKFSVWVKEDPSAGLGTNNTFNADRVELGIRGYDEENQLNVDDTKVFYQTQDLADTYVTSTGTYSGDWSSGWVLLEFASTKLIQLPDESLDPVMELSISPSNPGSSDSSWNRLSSGSILIADPTLEYTYKTW